MVDLRWERAFTEARNTGRFGPVMNFNDVTPKVLDLTGGARMDFPPDTVTIGKFNERRKGLYETDLFKDTNNDIGGFSGKRDIHIGVDIGGAAGVPVLAVADGEILHSGYNAAQGDYGHVIVTQHQLSVDGHVRNFYALYGHLSASSTIGKSPRQKFAKGDVIGYLGGKHENGGWEPHVHFQLSIERPETHDMPGVVSDEDHPRALTIFPDPRLILGEIYSGAGKGPGGLWERSKTETTTVPNQDPSSKL